MADEPIEKPSEDADPEPEGVIEVELQGQKVKVAPVGVISAERKRARESTEQKVRAEYEPLKAKAEKADRLEADLTALKPHLDYLRQHPELLKREEPPEHQKISDEEAERYARRFELYTANGPDIARAKMIIADNRKETEQVARAAAQEAIRPLSAATATQASRQNFVWAAGEAQKRGVAPADIAAIWLKLEPDLTQHPEVAQHILKVAIGEAAVAGKLNPAPPEHEPIFSEAPGGGRSAYRISEVEKRLANISGMSEKDFSDRAKTYQPDAVNVLGD